MTRPGLQREGPESQSSSACAVLGVGSVGGNPTDAVSAPRQSASACGCQGLVDQAWAWAEPCKRSVCGGKRRLKLCDRKCLCASVRQRRAPACDSLRGSQWNPQQRLSGFPWP